MMGWVAPPGGTCATVVRMDQEGMAMKVLSIIGVDLAERVFQLHGATVEGEVVFRKKLSRTQFVTFMRGASCVLRGDGNTRDGPPLGANLNGSGARGALDRSQVSSSRM